MTENPFPLGTMAWSYWESERKKNELAQRRMKILEGTEPPADFLEEAYLRNMGGPYGPRESWPKRWVECLKCGVEYLDRGHPEGLYGGMFPPWLRHEGWLYPGLCEPCYALMHAIKPPAKTPVPKK